MAVVYILRNGDEDLFKVGWAVNLEKRLSDHHTSNPRLVVFRVIEAESKAAATNCEAYLKGILQARRYPGSDEFFALPAAEVEDAIEDAQRYLAVNVPSQREAERLAGEECDGRVLVPGDAEWEDWRRLLSAREAWCRVGAEKTRLENNLKRAMGTAAELEGIATWKTEVKTRLDEAALKAAEPDVWRAFRIKTQNRRFLPQ